MVSLSQVILLSGGLDSVVNLSIALEKGAVLLGLTFDYGQRASAREIVSSQKICRHYSIPHKVIHLPWLAEITSTSLVETGGEIPKLDPEDLDDPLCTELTAQAVWVPNRNGIFIHIAAAIAESLGADRIVTGFNKEEGATFPDNRSEFLDAVSESLKYSTRNRVGVISYTSDMDKKEIVHQGLIHHALFDEIWSCYQGLEKMCGECESCQRLKRGISNTAIHESMEARFLR